MEDKTRIHLDMVGGIAGDMFVSAMLDAFTSVKEPVFKAITQVMPEKAGAPVLEEGINAGIRGLRFSLSAAKDIEQVSHQHNTHTHQHSDETTYLGLCNLLKRSILPSDVCNIAIELLTIIGKAEAKIHKKPLEHVHFHELADWDSLMDVVAIAVLLDHTADCSWTISTLPLGGGLIQTQHGLIPVPAPATAEILKGFEFIDDGIPGERITPTGAAVLRYLDDHDLIGSACYGTLRATGYGLGSKNLANMPNILRVLTFESSSNSQYTQSDNVVSIEFDVDDMTAEELAFSLDVLRKHKSVLDIVVQTGRGKKNRAVELVRIMSTVNHYQNVIEQCFVQTSTIGLRYRIENRQCLPREIDQENGHQYKSVMRPNNQSTCKLEHDYLTSFNSLKERRAVKHNIEQSVQNRLDK